MNGHEILIEIFILRKKETAKLIWEALKQSSIPESPVIIHFFYPAFLFLDLCEDVMTSHLWLAWCVSSPTRTLTLMCELKQTGLSMFAGKLTGFERLYPRVQAWFESSHSPLFAFPSIIHGQVYIHTLTLRPQQPFPVFSLYFNHYQLHSLQSMKKR